MAQPLRKKAFKPDRAEGGLGRAGRLSKSMGPGMPKECLERTGLTRVHGRKNQNKNKDKPKTMESTAGASKIISRISEQFTGWTHKAQFNCGYEQKTMQKKMSKWRRCVERHLDEVGQASRLLGSLILSAAKDNSTVWCHLAEQNQCP